MPIVEPFEFELWEAVLFGGVYWPSADEGRVIELGRAWSNLGAGFRAAATDIKDLPTGAWTDDAGRMYAEQITSLRSSVLRTGDRMSRLGWLADAYGKDVQHAKTEIRTFVEAWEPEFRERPQQVAPPVAQAIVDLLSNIEARVRARAAGLPEPDQKGLLGPDEVPAAPEPEPELPKRGPGNPGPNGTLEGKKMHEVRDPRTGQIITDIDHIFDGILWEEKTAIGAQDPDVWAQGAYEQLERYIQARRELPEYSNAPIGLRLTRTGVEPALRNAIEAAVERFRRDHPGVDVRVEYY
jgi:hypothetical protein